MQEPDEVAMRITVDGGKVLVEDLRGRRPHDRRGQLDDTALARRRRALPAFAGPAAAVRGVAAEEDAVAGPSTSRACCGIDDPGALDLTRLWAPRGERDFLRVPHRRSTTGRARRCWT